MNAIKNYERSENNATNDFRSKKKKKRQLGEPSDTVWGLRKKRRMQCSTPLNQYRVIDQESPDLPPVALNHGDNSPLLVDPSIFENENEEEINCNVMRERKKTNVSDQLDILEMTPASDESTDTHARKVAETAEVVERGLARRGMAVLSRWNSAPSLACNAFLKNFPGLIRNRSLSVSDYLKASEVALWDSGSSFGTGDDTNGHQGVCVTNDDENRAMDKTDDGAGLVLNGEVFGGVLEDNNIDPVTENDKVDGCEKIIISDDGGEMGASGLLSMLQLNTPSREKRILSPDENTPIGGRRKMSTKLDRSTVMRMNWEYWQGMEDEVVDEGKMTQEPSNDLGTPQRRRISSLGALQMIMNRGDTYIHTPRTRRASVAGLRRRNLETPKNQPLIVSFTKTTPVKPPGNQ